MIPGGLSGDESGAALRGTGAGPGYGTKNLLRAGARWRIVRLGNLILANASIPHIRLQLPAPLPLPGAKTRLAWLDPLPVVAWNEFPRGCPCLLRPVCLRLPPRPDPPTTSRFRIHASIHPLAPSLAAPTCVDIE
jgi:hypothetical protein